MKAPTFVRDFRDLVVWQKGIGLVKTLYVLTKKFPQDELFGLTSQIRRAAVSIPSNIAEGQQRNTTNDFRRHIAIAMGSLAEVETQIIIATEIGYLDISTKDAVQNQISELRRMLCGLESGLKGSLNKRGTKGVR